MGQKAGRLALALVRKPNSVQECGGVNKGTVENAGKALSDLGYQYDDKRFPALVGTENFADTSGQTPSNLAEALFMTLCPRITVQPGVK